MRKAQVVFCCYHPNARYRHEKPNVQNLLEKKESAYVDVSSDTWISLMSISLSVYLSIFAIPRESRLTRLCLGH